MSKRDDLEIVIGVPLDGLAADLRKGAALVKDFGRDVTRSAPKADEFRLNIDIKGLQRSSAVAKETGSSFRGVAGDLAGFAAKAAIAGGALIALETGFSGVAGALDLVKSSVNMAADFEQNAIAFETMLDSAERAKEVMADLRKFAADTPFSSKEVTQGARQLLAYGVAAEELIPTLKLVGTLAAGTSTPLGENIYRYGTTKVQGVAHQMDINQLTNAGIDVMPGIAKQLGIQESQVRKFTEEGRVDFGVYQAALIHLGNTRFSGLLEKQANSLKGTWEQMTDAFDRAKLKLGQVIAEEAGLKAAGKDLESFADKVEKSLDGPALREGIRFTADLARGGAQIAYEFGRAAGAVGQLNLDGLTQVSPEIAKLATNVKEFVASVQNFKLDKRLVAELGVSLFKSIVYPLADAADWVNTDGKAYADGFKENFIEPMKEYLALIDRINPIKAAKDIEDWAGRNGLNPEGHQAGRDAAANRLWLKKNRVDNPADPRLDDLDLKNAIDVVKAAKDLPYFNPPRADEPEAHVLHRYKHLDNMINQAHFLSEISNFKQFQPFTDALRIQRGQMLLPYSGDPGGHFQDLDAILKSGKLPPRRADWVDIAPPASKLSNRETMQDRIGRFEQSVFEGIASDSMKAGFGKMYAEMESHAANAKQVTDGMRLSAGLGPLGSLSSILPALNRSDLGTGLKKEDRTPGRVVDLASRLNDEFDPYPKLMRDKADMERALKDKLISQSVFDQGWGKEVRGAADRLGIGGPAKLTDAVHVGSAEDARLLSNFMSGNQSATTEDLLKRIEQHLSSIRESNKSMERAPMPRVLDWGGGIG